jgi:N-carbamoyl-L-amino-acid hydrolase
MKASMPEDFEQMWATLAPLGRSSASGGYFRQPWTATEAELRAWFTEQCEARGLSVEADGNGNLLATWAPSSVERSRDHALPRTPGEGRSPVSKGAVLIGSHLDSVLDGGAYDGPLGVVSSLVAVDLLRERGVTPSRPVVVGAFGDEEGSRFGLACLGSRLATGATTARAAAELRDPGGTFLPDAMATAGFEPALGPADWVERIGCFVELHVEQGRDLVDRDAAIGLATGIWPHGRYRFDFTGEANHAGTTRMEDRHDPMLSYAMTALAAAKQARLADQRATFGRLEVTPNGTNAIPSRVTAWLDARGDSEDSLATLVAEIERMGADRAARDGTLLEVTPESVSGAVSFDAALTARLDEALGGGVPVIPTMAGHDAGILASAGVPTAMLFVRNPTGVSHSPDEFAETADCLAGVEALASVLEELVA